jgi:hypothetical protein
MKRAGHEDARFFIGTEVEHTPAVGLKTLFVVGVQPYADIMTNVAESRTYLDSDMHIEHVYFGANMSFPNPPVNDFHTWQAWEDMIKRCLDTGILCTLDVDSTCVEGLVESGLAEYSNFIPMISVKLPYLLGYNATITRRQGLCSNQSRCMVSQLTRLTK